MTLLCYDWLNCVCCYSAAEALTTLQHAAVGQQKVPSTCHSLLNGRLYGQQCSQTGKGKRLEWKVENSKHNCELKMGVPYTQMSILVSLTYGHFYGDGPGNFSHYTNTLAKNWALDLKKALYFSVFFVSCWGFTVCTRLCSAEGTIAPFVMCTLADTGLHNVL